MSFGYQGKMLEIQLDSQTFTPSPIPEEDQLAYTGGAGYNARLLFDRTDAATDPLGPENPLIFGAGPLVGLPFPSAARSTCTALSPLTGLFGDSNCGGTTAVALKKTGFDHIVIHGKSRAPLVLIIGGKGTVRFEDARRLWGQTTSQTMAALEEAYPKSVPLVIGPAGENQVLYSTIHSKGGSNFSRTGMGTVMGSKNLKAIVLMGKMKIRAHDPDALRRASQSLKSAIKDLGFPNLFKKYGTHLFLSMLVSKGLLFEENWRRKTAYAGIQDKDVIRYMQATNSRAKACFGCPLACRREWEIRGGDFGGARGHGCDVAHVISFGLTLGLKDITHILYLANQCNELGMDINELAGTLGMAIDALKNGELQEKALPDPSLDFGNTKAISRLLPAIAKREGVGEVLAMGTRKAAQAMGPRASQYALTMKGMHWPAHSAPPFVLAFSISTRGGDFLKAVPHLLLQSARPKLLKALFSGTSPTRDICSHGDKGRAVWWHENYKLLIDNLGTCFYLSLSLIKYGYLFPDELGRVYGAATGHEVSGKDLMTAAERGNQVERAINALRGHHRKHDAFTKRPEPDSWAAGIDLDKQGMLDEYYAFRGLSSQGRPTVRRLQEIGLENLSQTLKNHGVLDEAPEDSRHSFQSQVQDPLGIRFRRGLPFNIFTMIEKRVMTRMIKDSRFFRRRFRPK
jgi:aldehyde:ferredoxin oxidoreductase